jgi:hypothetical protein
MKNGTNVRSRGDHKVSFILAELKLRYVRIAATEFVIVIVAQTAAAIAALLLLLLIALI